MTVNANRIPLNSHHDPDESAGMGTGPYQQVASTWRFSVFKLCAARTIGETRSALAEAQAASSLLARAMCVDIGPRQPNAEIRRKRPLPLAVAQGAVEDEVAGDLTIVRMLPEPSHWRGRWPREPARA